MRLTDLHIRKLQPPAVGQKTYFDSGLPGFGVRISQGGSKSFIVMYGPNRRLKTIGRHPELSLAQARKNARRLLSELDVPVTPNRPIVKVGFEEARERFLDDCKSRNKPRTVRDYDRLLRKHFKYHQTIDEISRTDIMSAVERLSETPSERQHAFVAIRVMMNWCERQGMIERSPVPKLATRAQERSHTLSDEDLSSVWKRAEEVGYPYGTIVQLLITTGQRRGEIAGLRFSWFHDQNIVFPEGFAKNKREHRLPISKLTGQILNQLPRDGDLLFPARGGLEKPFNGWGKSKKRFDEPLNVGHYVLHDLRRTFSSNMARLGTPIHVTERLLNHISGTISGVAAVYNRYSYADEMRSALQAHDDFLDRTINAPCLMDAD